jgi:hypothetical protein
MDEKTKEVYQSCNYFLSGHKIHIPHLMKEIFQELADYVDSHDFGDTYGTGDYIQAFENI